MMQKAKLDLVVTWDKERLDRLLKGSGMTEEQWVHRELKTALVKMPPESPILNFELQSAEEAT